MRKLRLHSPNRTQENLAKLRELFPGCVTEASDGNGTVRLSVDFDLLRQELSGQLVEGPQERYRLDWPGKREAVVLANAPISKTLRPAEKESVDFATTRNLFIEGDNLEALKLIQETYFGSVKMIYIDPPYNTGRNLLYRNDFSQSATDFLERSNQVDGAGGRLVANPETNGRFHSDWLSMIYQRLKVAKYLLAKDGVLVCSIDENEFATLSVLMKEIFSGSQWEHAYVSVVNNPRGQQGTNFSYVNEYLIFVFPVGMKTIGNRTIKDEEVSWSQFRNWGGESERWDAKNCFYPVLVRNDTIIGFGDVCPDDCHPGQTEWKDGIASVHPIDDRGIERKWRYARQSVEEIANLLRARRSEGGYQIEIGKTFTLYRTVWTDKRYDSNEYGTKLINSLIEGSGFTFPKSLWAVYDPIKAVTGEDKTAIVLDFFAGSATTAHAVMQLNADDGGNRRFIMVQLPEPIEPRLPPHRRGYTTIAEISKERIRRAGAKICDGSCHPDWNKDVGFRVLKVDTSNMRDVSYRPDEIDQSTLFDAVDTVKPDRSFEDLLFQVLVDCGVDLTLPIRRGTVEGKTVFFVDDNAVIACFDTAITEELATALAGLEPLRAVFREIGFTSDAAKINVEQIFRELSPATGLMSI